MKFSAYDIINKKPIDLYKIILSSCGGVIAFQDLNGDKYGPHQIRLSVDISILRNETVVNIPTEPYAYGDGWVSGKGWEKGGGSKIEVVSIKEHRKVKETPDEAWKKLEKEHKATPSFTGKSEGGTDGNVKR